MPADPALKIVCRLIDTRNPSDTTYNRARDMFGIDLVMEVVTLAGLYALVAMMLKAFDAPVPGGARPLHSRGGLSWDSWHTGHWLPLARSACGGCFPLAAR